MTSKQFFQQMDLAKSFIKFLSTAYIVNLWEKQSIFIEKDLETGVFVYSLDISKK